MTGCQQKEWAPTSSAATARSCEETQSNQSFYDDDIFVNVLRDKQWRRWRWQPHQAGMTSPLSFRAHQELTPSIASDHFFFCCQSFHSREQLRLVWRQHADTKVSVEVMETSGGCQLISYHRANSPISSQFIHTFAASAMSSNNTVPNTLPKSTGVRKWVREHQLTAGGSPVCFAEKYSWFTRVSNLATLL